MINSNVIEDLLRSAATTSGVRAAGARATVTENAKRSLERRQPSNNVEAPRAETRAKRELEGGPNRRLGGGLLILPKEEPCP